jgi:putative protease
MADPGLIMLVRERWPEIDIHLSVQANTMNYASVRFWQQIGIKRVILSRELSLDQVAEIREACPDMELEVFVHGALCIAYSGRCLLSGYFNHRDANQGTCTNSCRWDYKISEAKEDISGDIHPVFLLEEQQRPGEQMAIEEDEHGTYIMNSKDLRAVEHVERLVRMGIDSLKIEGRTKSHYYVARTAQVYRRAIDDAVKGESFNPTLLGELDNLANRGYTDGFFERHHHHEYQNYIDSHSKSHQQRFVGELLGYDPDRGLLEVDVKNRFSVGDELELITPEGNHSFQLESMQDMNGQSVEVAPGSGYQVRIPVAEGDYSIGLLACRL